MVATKEKKLTSGKPRVSRASKVSVKKISAEQRYQMVAEAAYYLAEASGFDSLLNTENWLKAESAIAKKLDAKK